MHMNRSTAIVLAASAIAALPAMALAADNAGGGTPDTGIQNMLIGEDAFGGWQENQPGVWRKIEPSDLPQPYATKSASNSPGLAARPADAEPQGARRVQGRTGQERHGGAARHGAGAERRHLRRRQRRQRDRRAAHEGRRGQAGQGCGLRQRRPRPALRHRLLSARQSQVGVRRQRRQHRALSLQGGRHEGLRTGRDGGQQHPVEPSLDARHRLLAGRQDALRRRRLRLQRRRGGQAACPRAASSSGRRTTRSARCGEPRKAAPR